MTRIALLLAGALAALGACSTAPGTGWSRSDDLRVYGAMKVFQRAALDEEMLCAGFSPESTRDHWESEFGTREATVVAALEARYGAPALAEARATWAPRVACRTLPDAAWRLRYARLLRLLELRLRLAAETDG
jgi:hypothetical protein